MQIDPDIQKKYFSRYAGKIYHGIFPHRGNKLHCIVIIGKDPHDMIHYFCVSSSDKSKNRCIKNDPYGIVYLDEDEQRLFFQKTKETSFIYCGDSNHNIISLSDFFRKSKESTPIELIGEINQSLYEKIIVAIESSVTHTLKESETLINLFRNT